jgi:hypothetical protein
MASMVVGMDDEAGVNGVAAWAGTEGGRPDSKRNEKDKEPSECVMHLQ